MEIKKNLITPNGKVEISITVCSDDQYDEWDLGIDLVNQKISNMLNNNDESCIVGKVSYDNMRLRDILKLHGWDCKLLDYIYSDPNYIKGRNVVTYITIGNPHFKP